MAHSRIRRKEGVYYDLYGWDTVVGRSTSIQTYSSILIEIPLVGKACWKNKTQK